MPCLFTVVSPMTLSSVSSHSTAPLSFFLSLCVFDPISFLRFVFRSMGEGLFTGMWTPCQSLPHGRKCLFLSQQPLALYRPSWVGGARTVPGKAQSSAGFMHIITAADSSRTRNVGLCGARPSFQHSGRGGRHSL